MSTLHLDIKINDLAAWKAGYAEHADSRRRGGVRRDVVRHPVGDDTRLLIDLDFATAAEATAFLHFLEDTVWKDQPILAAQPDAVILEDVAT